jgi:predicted lipoprotein
MRIRVTSLALAFGAISVAHVACDSGAYPAYDRVQLLRETTEMLILPAFDHAATAAGALRTTTAALCATPTPATLQAAQSAWRDSFIAYHATVAYQIGPSRAVHLTSLANWPPDIDLIDDDIVPGVSPYTGPIDASFVNSLANTETGYAALEYLLFAYPPASTDTLSALADARRCALAATLADRIAGLTEDVNAAWRPSGQNYEDIFVHASDPTVFVSPQASVAELVSQVDEALDKIRDDRLGTPLGRTMHVGPVESPYAHASVAAMEACFASASSVWSGTPHGLDAFLRTRNVRLADGMIAQFETARVALAALESPPLSPAWETYADGQDRVVAGVENPDYAAGNAAYDALVVLQQALTSDVGSTMGLSVGLPADGD